eukprot:9487625-Pyramimonas_sp.AAC.1
MSRIDDIELATASCDAVILTGTQRRTKLRVEQKRAGPRWRLDAGFQKGANTNKSTGIMMSFGKKLRQKMFDECNYHQLH